MSLSLTARSCSGYLLEREDGYGILRFQDEWGEFTKTTVAVKSALIYGLS